MPFDAAIETLKTTLHGRLILPTDVSYDDVRRVWNGMIDKHPALVVQCANEDDVIRTVRFARDSDLPLAVRGGGHSVAGFGTCDDGVVLDLSPMKTVRIDPVLRTARAQPGLTWGEFDEATQVHGLATTGGLVSTTGIAGFTLGGGIGWLMRKHGLALDNLVTVDIVTAAGEHLHASAAENADLFWGVRGGGGNFGVVTSFEYRLHAVGPDVFGGAIFHPIDRARELLSFYREWAPALPDEMTTMAAFLKAPPEPFVPQDLVGTHMVAIALCHAGPIEEGEKLVQPLRALAPAPIDLLGRLPYRALQGMFDATAPKGIHAYWKTEYLAGLDDRAIATLAEHAGRMRSPFSALHVHHVEGAVKRVPADETAFAHRDARYVLNIIGSWADPAESDAHIGWTNAVWRSIEPSATGAVYLNFLGAERQERVKAAYGEKYERLLELKKKYDPTNVFHLNQNIRPEPAGSPR